MVAMFNYWKLKMKKFTLFNIKWHPIRFIIWIFATKCDGQVMKKGIPIGIM